MDISLGALEIENERIVDEIKTLWAGTIVSIKLTGRWLIFLRLRDRKMGGASPSLNLNMAMQGKSSCVHACTPSQYSS